MYILLLLFTIYDFNKHLTIKILLKYVNYAHFIKMWILNSIINLIKILWNKKF